MASIATPTNNVDVYQKVRGYHKRAFAYINKGLEMDEKNNNIKAAIENYLKGIMELKNGIAVDASHCSDDKERERLIRLQQKMKNNLTLSEERMNELSRKDAEDKQSIDNRRESKSILPKKKNEKIPEFKSLPTKPTVSNAPKPNLTNKFRGLDKDLVNRILNEVVEDKVSISFDDIAGNESAKESIKEIIIYPMLRPDLYTGLRTPTKGVLLFGPPGNGKSLLAKAVAYESKCVFFNITAASLMSKWVGESEKMVRALFTMARELQPCVIFMDEIDSLLASRKSGDKDVNRKVLNEFLQEFDGTRSSDSDRILVLGATNRPFELDDAALRRFPKRIYIPLPTQETRFQLLKLLLEKEGNPLKDHELMKIASLTQNYSSHDLTCLAKEAALQPLRSLDRETFQSISTSDVRKLNFKDFQESLKKVRPAVSSNSVREFDVWNSEFGDVS